MADLAYRSPKTEVRPSPIQGRGLFARAPIGRGEIVAIKGGYVVAAEEWPRLARTLGPAEIQIADGFVIAPVREDEREGAMLFTNHSCEPNIALQGQIVFVAMRDIEPGEELTHDWATTDDGDYTMPCRCHTPSCRQLITGKDWLNPTLQQKYEGYFAWHLQQKITASSPDQTEHAIPTRPTRDALNS